MKTAKKLITLVLAFVLVLGLVACIDTNDPSTPGTNPGTNPGTTKDPVVLEWYYRGNGVQKDTKRVEEEFNKLLKTFPGMEHVTVHLNCFTGAEYGKAVALAQSADQQIDILNNVYLNFVDQVRLGSYMPLDDLLADNKDLRDELPQWLWDLASVDGKIYMVPHYQRAANQEYLVIPKEYMQYADEAAIRAMCADTDRTVQEVADVLAAYVKTIQNKVGPTKYAYPIGQLFNTTHGFTHRFDNISNNVVLMENANGKVEYLFNSTDAKKAYEISAQWYDDGLIHPDYLTIKDSETNFTGKNMLNPVSYCFTMANGAGSEEIVSAQLSTTYGFDVVAIPIWNNYYIQNAWGAGGDGITAKCKNPKEAMRLLELMNTEEGAALYNMVVYGLEGVHYEKIDETHIKTLEYDGSQGGADTSYAAMKWIMGNTFHAYLNQGCADGENEIALEINESKDNAVSPLMGFRVDIKPVENEISQMTAVMKEFNATVSGGVMGTAGWQAKYDEFVNKLEAAGMSKVLAEIQRQVDAFLAGK